jgi:hypothetical protein
MIFGLSVSQTLAAKFLQHRHLFPISTSSDSQPFCLNQFILVGALAILNVFLLSNISDMTIHHFDPDDGDRGDLRNVSF